MISDLVDNVYNWDTDSLIDYVQYYIEKDLLSATDEEIEDDWRFTFDPDY
jgi:hypothetical protein